MSKEKQQQILLGVIMYFVFLVLFNNIVLVKLSSKLKMSKETLIQTKQEEMSARLKAEALTSKEQELKEAYISSKKVLNMFIKNSDKKILIGSITDSGKSNDVIFDSMSFKEEEKEKYKEFIIDGELSSDFSGILNFFYSFDNIEKKVKIDSCKIKKSEKGVTADVELSTYMLNEVIKSGKE